MAFKKLLALALFSIASCANIILIGDSRFCGMAYYVMGFDYTYHNEVYGTGSNIRSTSARKYNGHSIQVTAEVGASASTFLNTAKDINKSMTKQLSSAAAGTKVLLWLGVNGLDGPTTLKLYKQLASTYKNLNFYAISVTGVGSKSGITNAQIKTLNSGIQSGCTGLSNLKYKSILQNNDPTKIYNSSTGTVTLVINDSTTDSLGLHYLTSGYKAIFDAMIAGI